MLIPSLTLDVCQEDFATLACQPKRGEHRGAARSGVAGDLTESDIWIHGQHGDVEDREVNLRPGLLPSPSTCRSLVSTVKEHHPEVQSFAVDVDLNLVSRDHQENAFQFWNLNYSNLNIKACLNHDSEEAIDIADNSNEIPNDSSDFHIEWESIRQAYALESSNCEDFWGFVNQNWDLILPPGGQ